MTLTIEKLEVEGLSPVDSLALADRVERVLSSWERTPYLPGCQKKGAGVDCVRFVSGVLDELYGESTAPPRLPQDISFHHKETCFTALKGFLSRYSYGEVTDGRLQPGDVLITGPTGGGPGHAIFTGPHCLWHCDSHCVSRTGLSFSGGVYYLKKVIRFTDKERWLDGFR